MNDSEWDALSTDEKTDELRNMINNLKSRTFRSFSMVGGDVQSLKERFSKIEEKSKQHLPVEE